MNATVTREVYEAIGQSPGNVDSLSLRLNKYLNWDDTPQNDTQKKPKLKQSNVECIAGDWNAADNGQGSETGALLKATRQVLDRLPGGVYFQVKLKSRMMVDMGGGVLENSGLCVHSHLNVPMIPGSALKGLASHQMWVQWSEATPAEKQRIALQMVRIFGCPPLNKKELDKKPKERFGYDGTACAGTIDFLNALPDQETVTIEADILTPHAKEAPKPNAFLAVKAGTLFRCWLRKNSRGNDEDLTAAAEALQRALEEHGAGAKTAAGYGWLVLSKSSEQLQQEKDAAEATARQKKEAVEAAERERMAEAERIREKHEEEAKINAMSPLERARYELHEKCRGEGDSWNERRLISQLQNLANGKIKEDVEMEAIIACLADGVCDNFWANKLRPLLNAKPKKDQIEFKKYALALDKEDRRLHGKEGRRLK